MATIEAIAIKRAGAIDRIQACAKALADNELEIPNNRDPFIQEVNRLEAIAGFLETLCAGKEAQEVNYNLLLLELSEVKERLAEALKEPEQAEEQTSDAEIKPSRKRNA